MSWPCVLAHRWEPERPRRSLDGLLVCRGCLAHLEQCLAELPFQHRALTRVLALPDGAGAKVDASADGALPINAAVAELRVDILWKLVSWLRLVAEERGISEPTSNDMGVVTCWLLVHLRWSCARDWVDEYALELSGMRGRANALLYPSGRRRITVGDCVEPGCVGTLTATVARTDDVLPSSVDCSQDPEHTWSAGQWPALGRRLHGPAGYERRAAAAFLEMINGSTDIGGRIGA